jgi:hypothetical protein
MHVDAERSAVGLVMPHEVNGERIVQLFGVLTIPENFFLQSRRAGQKNECFVLASRKPR